MLLLLVLGMQEVLVVLVVLKELVVFVRGKGTQGFIHCLFKAASLATINKQMLSSLATYEALSLVITKPSFIWFGSASVDISTLLENSW